MRALLISSKAHRLAQIFDRRAQTFSEVAFLPREIAQRMHERLDYIVLKPKRILDAGCGPGQDWPTLQARFPNAKIVGLDISRRMLLKAQLKPDTSIVRETPLSHLLKIFRKLYNWFVKVKKPVYAVQGDLNTLPFAPACFELLWSNLALPWQGPFLEPTNHCASDEHTIHPLARLFSEWQHVLGANGLLMFSTLGPDSLQELRSAWAEVDAAHPQARVLNFVDMHDIGDMLVHSGFENPVMDAEKLTLTYRSAESLLKDIRRWGAYPGAERPDGLTGKGTYQALLAALKKQQNPQGIISLTFEIVYGHAWRAAPTTASKKHNKASEEYAPVQFHPPGSMRPKH